MRERKRESKEKEGSRKAGIRGEERGKKKVCIVMAMRNGMEFCTHLPGRPGDASKQHK